MRRLVAALVLAGIFSMAPSIPSASAQGVLGTGFLPGLGLQCTVNPFGGGFGPFGGGLGGNFGIGGFPGVNVTGGVSGVGLPLGTISGAINQQTGLSPFNPFNFPCPATGPALCQVVSPLNVLATLIAAGLGTSSTTGGVTTFTFLCTGNTFTLTAGQNVANTTLAGLFGQGQFGQALGGLGGLNPLFGTGTVTGAGIGGTITNTTRCQVIGFQLVCF
jgi:hypothetical protein